MKPKNRVRIILAEQEMSTKELAGLVGVSHATVARWASNTQQPSLKNIYKMSEVLKLDICDFLVRPKYEDN